MLGLGFGLGLTLTLALALTNPTLTLAPTLTVNLTLTLTLALTLTAGTQGGVLFHHRRSGLLRAAGLGLGLGLGPTHCAPHDAQLPLSDLSLTTTSTRATGQTYRLTAVAACVALLAFFVQQLQDGGERLLEAHVQQPVRLG